MRERLSGAFTLARCEAFFAIDRAITAWPERNFAFLITVRAYCFVHDPGIRALFSRRNRHGLLAGRFKRSLGNPAEDGVYLRLQRDEPLYQRRNQPHDILIYSRMGLRSFTSSPFFHRGSFSANEAIIAL